MPELGTPSVRDRIMEALKVRFLAVQSNVDGHVITWNTAVRRSLTDIEMQSGDAISLIDASENKSEEVGFIRADMTVFTEFWIRLEVGDDPSQHVNNVLADVQLTMRADINTAETPGDPTTCLTINITEIRNETDIEGASDMTVGGVIQWSVLYRHNKQDPRLQL